MDRFSSQYNLRNTASFTVKLILALFFVSECLEADLEKIRDNKKCNKKTPYFFLPTA